MKLQVLSAGAAQGLVGGAGGGFLAAGGAEIAATFGAVGAIREKLLAGTAADLVILTQAAIAHLEAEGHVMAGTAVDVGVAHTAIAVRSGDEVPAIVDAASLRDGLRAADAIYFPDPTLATAGIHFTKILRQLGVATELGPRLRTFANGNAAMAAMACYCGGRPLGCTQVTEIIATPGVEIAGLLPHEFELATVYTAAVATRAAQPEHARTLAALLAGEASRELRERVGFASVP